MTWAILSRAISNGPQFYQELSATGLNFIKNYQQRASILSRNISNGPQFYQELSATGLAQMVYDGTLLLYFILLIIMEFIAMTTTTLLDKVQNREFCMG